MPVNGRQKGSRGEREFVHWLRSLFGFNGRRGQHYSGTADSADVITDLDPVIYFDVKRVERLMIYDALEQVAGDAAGTGRIPVVMHKKNRGPWIAVLDARDLIALIRRDPAAPLPCTCPFAEGRMQHVDACPMSKPLTEDA